MWHITFAVFIDGGYGKVGSLLYERADAKRLRE
jgi:hypothetical protein